MAVYFIDWSDANVALYEQTKFWCHVYKVKNAAGDHPYRMLAKMVLTNLSLSLSNAFVERIFSQVSLVKNKLRNKMGMKLLNSILMIRAHCLLKNSCCKDIKVTEAMLHRFKSDVIYESSTGASDTMSEYDLLLEESL